MDTLPNFTERIRAAFADAETRGLKQADLARTIGVSRATVGDWLHGRSVNIRPEHLFAVADALNVEARWLATGKGPRPRRVLSRDQLTLVEQYHRLSDAERGALRLLVTQIADGRENYET